ncbi:MAG TPA: universal stress protein [Solirubrobacteraceae bacterium]|jgi:nucleotide-binding universal stress UspA family protein|nr:universal stress protein [Solirubrobacteraceae bacterium]
MYSTIAVATDGSETAGRALEAGLEMAQRYGSRVVLISAYTPLPDWQLAPERTSVLLEFQWASHIREEVDAILAGALQQVRDRGLDGEVAAAEGEPADVICQLAAERQAGLLVIGNKGIDRKVFGSVPRSVCAQAPCTVVLVKTT